METILERVGALDVHKAQITACVQVPDAEGRHEPHLAELSTTVAGLVALRDWLAAFQVTHVAMEATGGYRQPVWHIMEDDFKLTLCKLRGGFVPPKLERQLRTLKRCRKTQITERQREANRLHKALEDIGIVVGTRCFIEEAPGAVHVLERHRDPNHLTSAVRGFGRMTGGDAARSRIAIRAPGVLECPGDVTDVLDRPHPLGC
jgi:transposase